MWSNLFYFSSVELHLISFRQKATPWECVCVSVHVRACAVIMRCLEHCHSVRLLGVRQTGREFWLRDRGLQCSHLQRRGSWLGSQGGVPQRPACLVSKAEAEVRGDECRSTLYTVHLPLDLEVKWPWAYFMLLPVTSVASVLQVGGEVEKEQCGKPGAAFCFPLQLRGWIHIRCRALVSLAKVHSPSLIWWVLGAEQAAGQGLGSGIISYCFLILDFLEENYSCFMSFLYEFFKKFIFGCAGSSSLWEGFL